MKNRLRAFACLALLLAVTVPAVAGSTAKELFTAAAAREEALRAAASSGKPATTAADYRSVAAAYEVVVRRYHGSGYADNALYQAGMLLLDAHERFGDSRDRILGSHYLKRLVAEYPASSLAKPAGERLAKVAASPSRSKPETEPGDKRPSSAAPPPQPAAPKPAGGKTTSPVVIRDIRRVLLPDVVRISIELEGEVVYRSERVDNPPRVLFDLTGTALGPGLREGSRGYADDVVKHIRVGRHPNDVTRVVLDLDGVKAYSVFTLYDPFRVVVDCVRERTDATQPSAPSPSRASGIDRPAADAAVAAAPPVAPTANPSRPSPSDGTRASAPPSVRPSAYPRSSLKAKRWRQIAVWPIAAMTPRDILWPVLESSPLAKRGGLNAPALSVASGPPPLPEPTPDVPAVVPAREAAPAKDAAPTKDVAPAKDSPSAPAEKPTAPAAGPNGYSLARQLGLGAQRIVLDPGHGGHDPGAEGVGVAESEVVLDVALRLEKLLKAAGNDVVMTRRTDEFIPLEERTAIANRAQGDLFLSIHANASRNKVASGIESYVLNFASNPDAEAVAARENAATGRTMSALPDIVKAITLNNKLDESRQLAGLVQRELAAKLRPSDGTLKNHGVKQAPFVVLIGASMPSVLVEISFITNREEGRLLKNPTYRQKIAEALFNGIRGYQKSLKGTRVTTSQ